MDQYPKDIFTENDDIDPYTLDNLGPLSGMAGVWRAFGGEDIAPKADGPDKSIFSERFELQPIDPQSNGPQLFYGLRYHQQVLKRGENGLFHDQIGYWLWEPATDTVIMTLSIPRGQTAMAIGKAKPDAKTFQLTARRGETVNGVCSNPFLEHAFRTEEFRIDITKHDDGSWSYDQTTFLKVLGQDALFEHRDHNRLKLIAKAKPNRAALKADAEKKRLAKKASRESVDA
ncbi:hypothetical protein M2323_000370 [Rhodoblastus acidophilus]|uniref:FABP family protein n=1 Tax=Rhodoblastus acidophilus TaxID=1074 RepID=UPI001614D06B|nr:heme-binding beta-barrel domain-containing protein [Rhodoblastus acidophilus]MCW2282609.1 hypothetical protein [Rhodoblastus acidophilus]MCW2331470.1 hypothetical protein [Rhodoblastus acidophilus]